MGGSDRSRLKQNDQSVSERMQIVLNEKKYYFSVFVHNSTMNNYYEGQCKKSKLDLGHRRLHFGENVQICVRFQACQSSLLCSAPSLCLVVVRCPPSMFGDSAQLFYSVQSASLTSWCILSSSAVSCSSNGSSSLQKNSCQFQRCQAKNFSSRQSRCCCPTCFVWAMSCIGDASYAI